MTQTEALKQAISRLEWFIDSYPHDITTSKEDFLRPFKEALAQPEQSGLNPLWIATHPDKLAQPEQEPVGALLLGGVFQTSEGFEFEEWDVEWNHKAVDALQEKLVTSEPVTLNLYTTPPQRTWVGLTPEEVNDIQTNMVYRNQAFRKVIEAIEAKLKEKNCI